MFNPVIARPLRCRALAAEVQPAPRPEPGRSRGRGGGDLSPYPTPPAGRKPRKAKPVRLLFVCRTQAALSPMAEGLARAAYGRLDIVVASAGLTAGPLDPAAVAVMGEIGIDIQRRQPASVGELQLEAYDIVVSLGVDRLGLGRHQMALIWDVPDPEKTPGLEPMSVLRNARHALAPRIWALGAVLTANDRA